MSDNANVSNRSAIINQVQRRMGWKLLGVLIVLVAYVSLKAIESAKQGYEEELNRPIVFLGKHATLKGPDDAESITVPITEIQKLVDGTEEGEVALKEKVGKSITDTVLNFLKANEPRSKTIRKNRSLHYTKS